MRSIFHFRRLSCQEPSAKVNTGKMATRPTMGVNHDSVFGLYIVGAVMLRRGTLFGALGRGGRHDLFANARRKENMQDSESAR